MKRTHRKTKRAGYHWIRGSPITKNFTPEDFIEGQMYKIQLLNGRRAVRYIRDVTASRIYTSKRMDSDPVEWRSIALPRIRKIWKNKKLNPQEVGVRRQPPPPEGAQRGPPPRRRPRRLAAQGNPQEGAGRTRRRRRKRGAGRAATGTKRRRRRHRRRSVRRRRR